MRGYERALMLQSLDTHWREHLAALDHLRQGIHLRGYAQKNPTQEYKREAFELFSLLLETIKTDVTKTLMMVQIRSAEELQQVEEPEMPTNVHYEHPVFGDGGAGVSRSRPPGRRRRGGARKAAAFHTRGTEDRPQRALPVRLGQEIQAVPR